MIVDCVVFIVDWFVVVVFWCFMVVEDECLLFCFEGVYLVLFVFWYVVYLFRYCSFGVVCVVVFGVFRWLLVVEVFWCLWVVLIEVGCD